MVVERLLSDDAIVASEKIAGMSDRGLLRPSFNSDQKDAYQTQDQTSKTERAKRL